MIFVEFTVRVILFVVFDIDPTWLKGCLVITLRVMAHPLEVYVTIAFAMDYFCDYV